MTAGNSGGTSASGGWLRQLNVAAAFAFVGVLARIASPYLPVQVAAIGLGVGLIAAAFMLAWAADAGEAVFSGGPVLAVVAVIAVLPEFIIEVHFAFIQQAELVTANLTGATRLLLTCAVALPLLVVVIARRRPSVAAGPIRLAPQRRLELGILLVAALFAAQILVRGSASVFDGLVLLALYVLYARRVQGSPDEEPAVVGVAAGLVSLPVRWRRPAVAGLIVAAGAVVVATANPFTHALLSTGTSLGFDPYLMIQSVVPVATEAPELVIVAVLVSNRRPSQGLALLLASSVSQWTLGLGSLPLAYAAGGGGVALPLAAREQLELGFTAAVTLFVVAALATLELERFDAVLMLVVFAVQLIYPTPFIRLGAGLVLLVFAVDLLASRWRHVGTVLRVVRPGGRSRSNARSRFGARSPR
jgi:cation:H+ antiporter